MKKMNLVRLSVICSILALAAGVILTGYYKKIQPARSQVPVSATKVTERGLTYCNQAERYCLDYPVSWSVNEITQTERDDRNKSAKVTKTVISSPSGRTISISPQFGGRPGGTTCFMERLQYNPASECLRQTYISLLSVQPGVQCLGAKQPHLIRIVSGSPSRGAPKYLLRFGSPRQHDYDDKLIVAGQEFISEGFDYDNLLTHCGRQSEDQPRHAHVRFDIDIEGTNDTVYEEPVMQEAETMLKSFRFL